MTREKLLDSASDLFRSRGIEAVSLDQIARKAGLTKGAIYGNFASKDDLVLAVAFERIEGVLVSFDSAAPIREQLRRLVRRAFSSRSGGRAHFTFLAELDLYALTREDLARRFIARAEERHRRSAANLTPFASELKLPPMESVIAAHALIRALCFQHACFPDVITQDVAITIVNGLLREIGLESSPNTARESAADD